MHYMSGFLGASRKRRPKTEDLENEDPPYNQLETAWNYL